MRVKITPKYYFHKHSTLMIFANTLLLEDMGEQLVCSTRAAHAPEEIAPVKFTLQKMLFRRPREGSDGAFQKKYTRRRRGQCPGQCCFNVRGSVDARFEGQVCLLPVLGTFCCTACCGSGNYFLLLSTLWPSDATHEIIRNMFFSRNTCFAKCSLRKSFCCQRLRLIVQELSRSRWSDCQGAPLSKLYC